MNWELRVDRYYAHGSEYDYMVMMGKSGWGVYLQAHGDQRWTLAGIYASAKGAMSAWEEERVTEIRGNNTQ